MINKRSLIKARIVLRRVGGILRRMQERERAKNVLLKHLEKIKEKPTPENVKKLNTLIDSALDKERSVAQGVVESNKVDELKTLVNLLMKKNSILEQQVTMLKEKTDSYDERKKAIESRIVPNGSAKEKIEALEMKYKKYAKKFSKKQLQEIRKRIDLLKTKV